MSWQFSSPVSNHKWLFSRAEGTLQDSVGQQQQRADSTWNFFVVERIEKEWEKEKSENASTKARSTHHCAVQSSFFSSSSSANDSNFGRERVALLLPFSCCVIALSVPLVFLSSSSTGAGKTRNRSQSCFFFLSPLSYSTSQVSPHMNLDGASSLFYNLFASSSSSMNMLCSVRAPREYNL